MQRNKKVMLGKKYTGLGGGSWYFWIIDFQFQMHPKRAGYIWEALSTGGREENLAKKKTKNV